MRRLTLFLVATALLACSSEPRETRANRARRLRADTAAPVDTAPAGEMRQSFVPPADWELVSNANGMQFRQPDGFTVGLNGTRTESCDASTPAAESPIFDKTFLDRWPLTLAMRRGDVNRIARTNGFTLDSTEVGTHESGGGSTTVRTGEGWTLLSGQTAKQITVLFAAVRHPAGCQLIWAARGAEMNPDTLGMVLSTVRFVSP